MTAKPSKIERLRIATPCPISWEQMAGDDRVRFCDHCHLNVYNIAELTRIEAETLIASTEGRLCGRLFQRADGTVLTKDCPVGLRALRRRVAKRTAAIFAAIVSLAGAAFGQGSGKDGKTSCIQQTRITRTNPDSNHAALSVSGTVLDMNGAVISGAGLTLTNLKTKATWHGFTDSEGRFRFEPLAEGKYSIKIEGSGFKTLTITAIALEGSQALNIDMTLEADSTTVTVGLLLETPLLDTTDSSNKFIISGDLLRRLPIPK